MQMPPVTDRWRDSRDIVTPMTAALYVTQLALVAGLLMPSQDARQIVTEAQQRMQVTSQLDDAKLIRRLTYLKMENVQGIWTATVLDMEDFTRNSRTVLTTESLTYNVPTQEDQFTIQALRRG